MLQIKKAAGLTATWKNTHSNYSSLAPLIDLRSSGLMPKSGLIWLGLGFLPPKRNAIAIDLKRLPSDDECKSVAGLDVVLVINGYITSYPSLRRFCGSLLAARPRRLLLIDQDFKRTAFLRLGGRK